MDFKVCAGLDPATVLAAVLAGGLVVGFSPGATAQVVTVPGDYAELQTAVDQVAPNTTIVVQGGLFFRIEIDKPLTIIGSPAPWILPDGPPGIIEPAILLKGPGQGEVRLSNLRVGGSIDALTYSGGKPIISGGGFDALHLYDCEVDAPWDFDWNGIAPGIDTIDVNVPLLWVERSTILGGDTSTTASYDFTQSFDAGTAIRASGTEVLVQATVKGGGGPTVVFDDPAGNCPTVCPGGIGGDGVVCDRLFQSSNSTVTAGVGTTWLTPNGTFCCQGSSGVAVVSNDQVALLGDLGTVDLPTLGQSLTIDMDAPGAASLLVLSQGVTMPAVLGPNHTFLKQPLIVMGAFQMPTKVTFSVPSSPALSGFGFGMQLFGDAGWSNPLSGVLAP